jgi:regulator of sigma E protease
VNLSWSEVLVTVPSFLVAVWILVTVHEFGHYWVARKLGFKVLRFSVGFGRPIWRRVSGADQTEYMLAAIPLGGYVKILDEREGAVPAADLHRSFTRRPHWQRICVLLAGPGANFIFAILVLAGLLWAAGITELRPVVGEVTPGTLADTAGVRAGDEFVTINGSRTTGQGDVHLALIDGLTAARPVQLQLRGRDGAIRSVQMNAVDDAQRRRLSDPDAFLESLGFRFSHTPIPPVVGVVDDGGPAAQAGMQSGDRIVALDGKPVTDFVDFAEQIRRRPGEQVELRVQRSAGEFRLQLRVASEEVAGKVVGRIHVGLKAPAVMPQNPLLRHVELGPLAALGQATTGAWRMVGLQARFVWRMVMGRVSIKNVSGPITTATMAGRSALLGFDAFFSYLIGLSLALGFMNLLPIPLLDGGQVVMQAIEWLKGSPLSERVQIASQQVGIMMVLLLLGLALFNDIARTIG